MIKQFYLNGKQIDIQIEHIYNAGYSGCNQQVVRAHINELAAIGVATPKRIPTFYPVPVLQLTSENMIQVGHNRTSAEVEYVYIVEGDKEYITIGSDHSDRMLETHSVSAAKQICPNVIASELWDFNNVKDHLDELQMTCDVYENGIWREYQRGYVTDLLEPLEIIELGREVVGENNQQFVLYSGTIPTIGEITYAAKWRITMIDQYLNKKISMEYAVEILHDSID